MVHKPKTIIAKTLKIFSDPVTWIKGNWEKTNADGTVCFCLDGCMNYVVTGNAYNGGDEDTKEGRYLNEAKEFVLDAIQRSKIGDYRTQRTIVTWNDSKKRTIGEVRTILRRALKAAA